MNLEKNREMRNVSHAFEFLTQNSSLGELCILHTYLKTRNFL